MQSKVQTITLEKIRIVPIVGVALGISLGLFGLMYVVISATGHGLEKAEALQTIDFVRLRKDSQVESMERRKPPPPPPKPPPPPSKMRVEAANVQVAGGGFAMPNVELSANVGGGGFVGQMGSGGGVGGLFDGDIIPLQRIPPQYPRDAARAGITGWVQLEVTVNADGTVRSARVIESRPKGMFEASAVQAVMRWKFKPKVVNGQPVAQRGSQKIEFHLNKAAS
jgi:protein TonB